MGRISASKLLAYHEAGHVVLPWALGSDDVTAVRMQKSTDFDAVVENDVSQLGEDARNVEQARLLGVRLMCEMMAGPMAEVRAGGSLDDAINPSESSDSSKAFRIARLVAPRGDHDRMVAFAARFVHDMLLPPIWPGVQLLAKHLKPGIVLEGEALATIRVQVMDVIDTSRMPKTWTDWRRVRKVITWRPPKEASKS